MKKRNIPDVLDNDEQHRLLAAMPGKTLLQRRSLAMIRLMLNAGLRSQEVCDLRIQNLSWPSGKLKVRGKGGRQRVLWLTDEDLMSLKAYIDESPSSNPSSNRLIFQTGPGKPINTRFLRYLMAQARDRTGIERLQAHLLRHTFATNLLSHTKNLPLVMKAMGHADISTTQIYTHIVDEELEAAMKTFRRKER